MQTVDLQVFHSIWTAGGDLPRAVAAAREDGYDGIEGAAPDEPAARREFLRTLADAGLPWIAEIATFTRPGHYLPDPRGTAGDHLRSLETRLQAAMEGRPVMVTVLGGSDAWPPGEAIRFHHGVVDLAGKHGVEIAIETHRGRPTFNPWATVEILSAVPGLRLTCDFSHWCVVTERFVLDEEPGILAAVAACAGHLHARVGYDQGPQVPDPRAPEFAPALEAHLRWWRAIWQSMAARGHSVVTMTPEFGPDGYLQCTPFTREPAGDLREINRWMAGILRHAFAAFQSQFPSQSPLSHDSTR